MKNGWRIIITVVLIIILLGIVCMGVGLMTGADMPRIYSVMDKQYNITALYEWLTKDVVEAFREAGFAI